MPVSCDVLLLFLDKPTSAFTLYPKLGRRFRPSVTLEDTAESEILPSVFSKPETSLRKEDYVLPLFSWFHTVNKYPFRNSFTHHYSISTKLIFIYQFIHQMSMNIQSNLSLRPPVLRDCLSDPQKCIIHCNAPLLRDHIFSVP